MGRPSTHVPADGRSGASAALCDPAPAADVLQQLDGIRSCRHAGSDRSPAHAGRARSVVSAHRTGTPPERRREPQMNNSVMDAVDLVIRATLLMGAGTLAALAFHRRSASFRLMIWSSSLGGTLMLAVLVPWSPRVNVPVRSWPGSLERVVALPEAQRFADLPSASAIVNAVSASAGESNAAPVLTAADFRDLPPVWLMTWVVGTVMIFGWGMFGRIGLAILARRATPIESGRWREIVDATSIQLGVNRRIAILESAVVGAPMT